MSLAPGHIVFSPVILTAGKKVGSFTKHNARGDQAFLMVLIGAQNMKHAVPSAKDVLGRMSEMGFYRADDIKELLGEETWIKFDKAFVEKHTGEAIKEEEVTL